MKRRDFLRNVGVLGLASVANSQLQAAESLTAAATSQITSAAKAGIKSDDRWNVIVVGGGPSGCAAAAAAAREGAKVLLIEGTGALGGMGTSGLLNAWCPFTDKEKIIYGGIAKQVFLESKKGVPHVRGNDWVPINSEYLKVVYDDLVLSAGVSVLFFSSMAAVEMASRERVEAVIVANKAGLTAYKADLFIDCTGDGDLAARAGAAFEVGDGKGTPQEGTLCFSLSNIDPYEFSLIGSEHSNRKDGPNYKMLATGTYDQIKDNHINDKLIGPGYLGLNAGHVAVDSTDPVSLSSAMITGRKIARQFQEGLAEYEPKTFAAGFLASTASLMGVRESRRIKCDYTFTVDDWVARREFDDGIGRNCYYIDIHAADARQYDRYGRGESHAIPFRSLLPVGLKNVFVAGRCLSADHYAHGSLRVMPPCLVTGEAVGVAAGQIVGSRRPDVHQVDIAKLRNRLKAVGQIL
jgi:hypothetical protein